MAQAARSNITSRFHNLSNEALADAIGQTDSPHGGSKPQLPR